MAVVVTKRRHMQYTSSPESAVLFPDENDIRTIKIKAHILSDGIDV